jgi:methionine--tRNA ligase beta chain
MTDTITFDEFSKLDFRVGRVLEAKDVEGSDKMIKLVVDFGELGKKVIFSGIKKWYKAEELIGKLYVFIFNLEPRPMFGEESQGMIIAAETEDGQECVLLEPDKEIAPGSSVH